MSCPISKKAMPRLRKRWPHCKEIFLPDNAKRLQADGYTTLNFDYRYFGESGGEPRSRLFELIHSLPDNLKERASVGNPSDCRRRPGGAAGRVRHRAGGLLPARRGAGYGPGQTWAGGLRPGSDARVCLEGVLHSGIGPGHIPITRIRRLEGLGLTSVASSYSPA